jgi:hypothetical protein
MQMSKPPRTAKKHHVSKPAQAAAPAPAVSGASAVRWLLLIHQIPPKPDYLRVKIGRRLQRVGAVAIKNSVYVLPVNPGAYEDFQWIVKEIQEGGGDAFISEASLVGEGLTDEAVRARFDAARDEEYQAVLADARALLTTARRPAKRSVRPNHSERGPSANTANLGLEHELAKLRRRHESVSAIDFFGAPQARAVAATLSEIQRAIRSNGAGDRERPASAHLDGKTWVTRRDVHVDRIASAWLIRRFIDRRPRFRFVDPKSYARVEGELRFDMFEAEYTHVGDACTFETLLTRLVPKNAALREIAEIVHDIDCKDAKFRRDEAPGLARLIAGVAHLCPKDEDRIERGARLFDDLYAAFGGDDARGVAP